uniref:Putative polyprotein n=1 Tax=Moniliophthora roreri TaxID=221103 RepID=A0A0W0FG47_MONRR
MFLVVKKNGLVWLVINLEELNAVTIQDSLLPPNVNKFAEDFLGYAAYGLFDLFSGFDARWVDVKSRPLQVFHSPAGARQQCTLVQGYTNSVQEFQHCVKHTLKGPRSRYGEAPIVENPQIQRFVWEYVLNLDKLLAMLINSGMTASGTKAVLIAYHLKIVGMIVGLEGWIISPDFVEKVRNWKEPEDVSEVRQFLGVVGVGRRWIRGFVLIAKPITLLLHKPDDADTLFVFTGEAKEAMQELIHRVTTAPVLIWIDYEIAVKIQRFGRSTDEGLVVVGVDSLWKGAGWAVYQIRDGKKRPAIYGSCMFNEREQNYGQPKSELYGMLKLPDDVPNTPILRWISWIRLFDFELRHVPANSHQLEDSLSRRPPAPGDRQKEAEDQEKFLDVFLNSVYQDSLLPKEERSLISVARYIFESLFIRLLSTSTRDWSVGGNTPVYQKSSSFTPEPFQVSNLLLDCSCLTETVEDMEAKDYIHPLPDFHVHNSSSKGTDFFLFGDEVVELKFTSYERYVQNIPHADYPSSSGHRFGVKDQDREELFTELRKYFLEEELPGRCVTNKMKLRFRKLAHRYFLHHDRLWYALKKKSDRLPRLVIEDIVKRGEVIAEVHLQAGHKGRDATYNLLIDRFYWPNLYDMVAYFVQSCIECQKFIQEIPHIPYSASWQVPLLRHFNIDCIHMPSGIRGFEYIVQAVEPTILWPEA